VPPVNLLAERPRVDLPASPLPCAIAVPFSFRLAPSAHDACAIR